MTSNSPKSRRANTTHHPSAEGGMRPDVLIALGDCYGRDFKSGEHGEMGNGSCTDLSVSEKSQRKGCLATCDAKFPSQDNMSRIPNQLLPGQNVIVGAALKKHVQFNEGLNRRYSDKNLYSDFLLPSRISFDMKTPLSLPLTEEVTPVSEGDFKRLEEVGNGDALDDLAEFISLERSFELLERSPTDTHGKVLLLDEVCSKEIQEKKLDNDLASSGYEQNITVVAGASQESRLSKHENEKSLEVNDERSENVITRVPSASDAASLKLLVKSLSIPTRDSYDYAYNRPTLYGHPRQQATVNSYSRRSRRSSRFTWSTVDTHRDSFEEMIETVSTKTYVCVTCGLRFKYASNLKSHSHIIHKDLKAGFSQCGTGKLNSSFTQDVQNERTNYEESCELKANARDLPDQVTRKFVSTPSSNHTMPLNVIKPL